METKQTAIHRVAIPKERLLDLSRDERVLFILLGSASNQITMLQKLVLFSSNKTPSDAVEQGLSGAQTQMLARIAVGVLNESWELVRTRFLGSPMAREYDGLLDKGGHAALDRLKKHFGAGASLLPKVRSNFAFHHPHSDDVESAFQVAIRDREWDSDWTLFMANSTLNWFYFASDVVILHAIMQAVGEASLVKAQEKLMQEMRLVADSLTEFIGAFLTALWKRRFGPEFKTVICADVSNAPDLEEPWIPFFIRTH